MKLNFSKSVRRIAGQSLPVLIGLLLSPLAAMGADLSYTNTVTISGIPPVVDAVNFYNYGIWNIFTSPYPYQTFDTLNYVNENTMTGSVGWNFDFQPQAGQSSLSASFLNDNGAVINGDSYLLISATNIVNKGTLISGAGGVMVLTGSNVVLYRGTLQMGPPPGTNATPATGSFNNYAQTNFTADTAIYDEYWGTNILTMDSSKLWTGSNVSSGYFTVEQYENCSLMTNQTPLLGPDPIAFVPTLADSITNAGPLGTNGLPSQIFNQAVFVLVNTNLFTPSDRFSPGSANASNLFQTITVQLTSTNTGPLYLVDTLASSTNSEYLRNTIPGPNTVNPCTGPTYRPGNYVLERVDNAFTNGLPGLGSVPNDFFYNSKFSNIVVQAEYSAYGAYVYDLSYDPSTSGASLTNLPLPGQLIIQAGNLDLTRAVVSDQALQIVIHASNLVGSSNATVSCQNLSFNLGSTNGNLNVTNLAANSSVPGLHGDLYAWSALWTNGMNVVTGSGTNAATNTIEMDYQVLLVDARGLSTTVPVTVQDLVLHSTNMMVSDSMTVTNSLLFDGRSLTLQGQYLNLAGNLQNWNSSIAPSLLYFTNNGTLTIPQNANFGGDTPTSYAAFVNNGSISVGGGETINSVYYQEGGSEIVPTTFFVTASTGLVENAVITAGQYVNLAGGTFQLVNSQISGKVLNFSVTNSLTDNGVGSFLNCGNGFNLFLSPQTGNLLASTITSIISGGSQVGHAWAGADLGPAASGLSSNVAIGTLALVALQPSQGPTFEFYGTTVSNAMYVKTLDLSLLTTISSDLPSMLKIDSGMKIYFSQVILGFSPPGGQSAASYLQAQFPGQFIQDPNIGQVVSSSIVISGTQFNPSGPAFVLTWNATAGATYSVLKTNVITGSSANWPVITTGYPPGGAGGGPLSYTDTNATTGPAYYRVRSP